MSQCSCIYTHRERGVVILEDENERVKPKILWKSWVFEEGEWLESANYKESCSSLS